MLALMIFQKIQSNKYSQIGRKFYQKIIYQNEKAIVIFT
ncbi:hypothetical protein ENHAE0001_0876 [Enhydrobacter aerosaccus SK60]|nr:hypothetical protein ENHAE0001_0876 [Enhydrobacter aerosaccus SK60]